MKDRVRETVFDLLGTAVRGATAIDLFAGTGAIGFEALSRGAARGVFAERHFPTADCLWRSAAELGLTERVTVVPGDVLLWSKRLPPLADDGPWLIFVSPPWSLFAARATELNSLMTTLARAAPDGSRLIVESDGSLSAEQLPGMLTDRAGETAWDRRALLPAILHQKKL